MTNEVDPEDMGFEEAREELAQHRRPTGKRWTVLGRVPELWGNAVRQPRFAPAGWMKPGRNSPRLPNISPEDATSHQNATSKLRQHQCEQRHRGRTRLRFP